VYKSSNGLWSSFNERYLRLNIKEAVCPNSYLEIIRWVSSDLVALPKSWMQLILNRFNFIKLSFIVSNKIYSDIPKQTPALGETHRFTMRNNITLDFKCHFVLQIQTLRQVL